MSSVYINCPVCTLENNVDVKSVDKVYCSACNSLLVSDNSAILSEIEEADNKVRLIEENYYKAYDEIPESFIPATMVYLNAKINGNDVKFLVDTGAQTSILPFNIVKCCNLDHLIDDKVSGQLRGVGQDKIMGRIHYVEVELGFGVIPCSFTICSNNEMIPLLGVDMMKTMGLTLNFKKRIIEIEDNIISMD